ncbi:MAG: hypothetical protein QXQ91_04955, partial [Nanopusillaceae archaeon]
MEDPYAIVEKWLKTESFIVVGRNIVRVDALDKAIGRAMFTEDYLVEYYLENALFVKHVLSSLPHAWIKSINASRA